VWNIWNWKDVERRFLAGRRLDLGLKSAA
jgi:hypothetical protein